MADRMFATSGRWGVASDGIQWMLMRLDGQQWRPLSFVRSTKGILARCMREKGVGDADSEVLLSGLPDSYDEWKSAAGGISEA